MNPPATAATRSAQLGSTVPQGTRRIGRRSKKKQATPGDRYVWAQSVYGKLEPSLTWVGVLLFMMVIITYRLPIGEVAVGMALLGMLMDRKGVVFPRFLLFLAAFVMWCWLGTFTTRFPTPSQGATLQLAKTGLIWWAALSAVRSRAQFRWMMLALVFLYATHPIRGGIMNIVVYRHTYFGRAVWNEIFANPNDYASFTMLFLSIAAGLVITERNKLFRWGAIASCAVFPIMMLYTQSRANFIALGVFALAVFMGQRKKGRSIAIGLVLVVVAAFTVPAQAWERLGGVASLGSGEESIRTLDTSANERIEIWRATRMVISENFVTGVGWGTYPWAHHETVTLNRHLFPYFINARTLRDAHSTYFTVLAETGILGFILWSSGIFAVLIYSERRRRRFKSVLPEAAQQLLLLEYGLMAYGIAAIWGSYAQHSFLYLHLTWIWVAASLLEKDALAFGQAMRGSRGSRSGRAMNGHPPNGATQRPRRAPFDPSTVGYPVNAGPSSAS